MQITSMIPSVHIIILNWNGYEDTLECVQSLSKINYKNCKIIIVDNGSDTDEIDKIVTNFPQVKLIKSKNNLGFSGGNNLAIDFSIKAECDFVLLLNNDTIVEPDFLNNLVDNYLKADKVGIAVPKINYYSNPQIIWYAGGFISRIKGSGYTIGVGERDDKHNKNRYVSFATGCCLLIKTKIIKEIGLLDPKYFLYLEDADYCLRNLLAGYKIIYVGQSKIYHKVSISSNKTSNLTLLYYVTRNRFYFVKKFYPNYYFIPFLYIILIFSLKISFWYVIGQKAKSKMVNKAISDYFSNNMGRYIDL